MILLLVAAAATVALDRLTRRGSSSSVVPVTAPPPASELVASTLVAGSVDGDGSGSSRLLWMALLSRDATGERGSIVYVPAHTAAEIPGQGLQDLAAAYAGGGMPLLEVSAENLLKIEVDQYLEITEGDARALFEAIGPVTVEVPSEVRVGAGRNQTRLVFSEGSQNLAAPLAARLLYLVGEGESDTDLGNRHIALWDGLMERFAPNPEALEDALLEARRALVKSNVEGATLAGTLETLAAMEESDLSLGVLPVEEVGAGGEQMYVVARDDSEEFLTDQVGSEVAAEEYGVQVLNGNGVPGMGRRVGARLVRNGFEVVISGNAHRLNYWRTRIITYDSSVEGVAAAQRARDLLGVGEVQISPQTQGIVNLTILVGKDFLRAK
jgi:anionic cell wall polymer biosynthesis LytR-Cps2A-Psr (LCP) family protein